MHTISLPPMTAKLLPQQWEILPTWVSVGGLNASGLRSLPNPWEDMVTLAFSDHELEQLILKLMNLQEGRLWGEYSPSYHLASLPASTKGRLRFSVPAAARDKADKMLSVAA